MARSKSATICLYFDDAWYNQYEVALPVLLEHEFKATFGVITGSIGTGNGFWKYMDEKELKELSKLGMEIAGHTRTHPHLTDNLTDKQLREEIIESKKHLEEMGFEVNTMIYPYYEWDDRVIEYVIEAGYTYARGGWPEEGAYNFRTAEPETRYHIPSQQITNQTLEEFKKIVNEPECNSLICLVYHFISDTSPEETSTPLANFEAQMAYLKEAGFTVALLPDLIEE
jgi:peptidoglycan/xylan/chitin deacetylase (PgdA/CDA1 family)